MIYVSCIFAITFVKKECGEEQEKNSKNTLGGEENAGLSHCKTRIVDNP